MRRRLLVFGAVCLLAVIIGVGAIAVARQDRIAEIDAAEPVPTVRDSAPLADEELLVFRNTALGDSFGKLAVVGADDPTGPRALSDLSCERVDFRKGVGVCLEADRGFVTTYRAVVFDENFETRDTVGLAGAPSRVRISPGGSLAGITVFVTGHSYADGDFSTQTTLVDLATAETVGDLEVDYEVIRDGESWAEIDFNFWGVTFIDDTSFYATLGTGGGTHLVRGDVTTRTLTVEADDVECPSLSPDGDRIAYKLRETVDGRVSYQLAVMTLETGAVERLAETRSVDDQVAWLDSDTVMYGLPNDDSPAESNTWTVPSDGSGAPELLVPRSWSTRYVS